MLARASTTSLACSQSPKLFLMRKLHFIGWTSTPKPRHTLAGSQHDSEKKPHPQHNPCYPERNVVLPSPTWRCCIPSVARWQRHTHASTMDSKTIPRVTNLCSAAHVANKGSPGPWHGLKRCIHRDLNKHEPTLDEEGGRVTCQVAANIAQEERDPPPARASAWQIGGGGGWTGEREIRGCGEGK